MHHRFGGDQAFMSSGQDALEFFVRNVNQQRMVFCAFDARMGNDLAATGSERRASMLLNRSGLRPIDQLQLDPYHPPFVRSFLSQDAKVAIRDPIPRSPWADIAELSKKIAPGSKSVGKRLVFAKTIPKTYHLLQGRCIRDHEVERWVFVEFVRLQVLSADKFQARNLGGSACKVLDVCREFKDEQAFGR